MSAAIRRVGVVTKRGLAGAYEHLSCLERWLRELWAPESEEFDDVLKSMKPHLNFTVDNLLSEESNAGKLAVDLKFESMDDFSPERVARRPRRSAPWPPGAWRQPHSRRALHKKGDWTLQIVGVGSWNHS